MNYHTVLHITFAGEKSPQVVNCATPRDMESRLAEFQSKDRVDSIHVFHHSHTLHCRRKWEREDAHAVDTSRVTSITKGKHA